VYERDGWLSISRDVPDRVARTWVWRAGYDVVLMVEGGQPERFCSWPAAADGSLCKHVVATALALTDQPEARSAEETRRRAVGPGQGRCRGAGPDLRGPGIG
jgi:hypothetical protein